MPRLRDFAQVDVFSAEPMLGNALAVVLDADGLTDAEMAAFARWTNLSETTFVLPPTTLEADYRLRIFTPGRELPFAGHPTLGSAHAWLEHGGQPAGEYLVQECAAGMVRLRFTETGLAFAAPPTLRTGAVDKADLNGIADCLGIGRKRFVAHQWVDNGPGWAAVQLASAEDVLALELASVPPVPFGVFGAYSDGSAHAYEVRVFAPGMGIVEDPVTGSFAAGLAQWLRREGAADAYSLSQGARVDRAGVIDVLAEGDDVWIGGASRTLIRGAVSL
ncbi:PhzF family phenazine biosynthesis protein [Microbacteriaceae bacterium VKM Ac-2854]|nr:PhzF family phenazine biosynthesis protein [Microbacteriaceae bacterium VKM Ac-2854]